jgi:hypothetical protein
MSAEREQLRAADPDRWDGLWHAIYEGEIEKRSADSAARSADVGVARAIDYYAAKLRGAETTSRGWQNAKRRGAAPIIRSGAWSSPRAERQAQARERSVAQG